MFNLFFFYSIDFYLNKPLRIKRLLVKLLEMLLVKVDMMHHVMVLEC